AGLGGEGRRRVVGDGEGGAVLAVGLGQDLHQVGRLARLGYPHDEGAGEVGWRLQRPEQGRGGQRDHQPVAGAPHVLGVAGGVVGGAPGRDHHVGHAFRQRGQLGDDAGVALQHPRHGRGLLFDLADEAHACLSHTTSPPIAVATTARSSSTRTASPGPGWCPTMADGVAEAMAARSSREQPVARRITATTRSSVAALPASAPSRFRTTPSVTVTSTVPILYSPSASPAAAMASVTRAMSVGPSAPPAARRNLSATWAPSAISPQVTRSSARIAAATPGARWSRPDMALNRCVAWRKPQPKAAWACSA